MSDELLPYYERELKYLLALGKDFAERHPQLAGRLKLGADEARDPFVERLLQGVAFLNARIRHKLEDDFPELTHALLGVLYPHYLRPIPSLGVVQMELDGSQHGMVQGFAVPRGTQLESEPDVVLGEACQYKTAYDTTLWPLRVSQARILRRPFTIPPSPLASRAPAALHLQFQTFSPATKIGQLQAPKLRLYLNRGNNTNVYRLLEMLLTDVVEICLAPSASSDRFVTLPASRLQIVGFGRDEALLPGDARTFPGYRMLSEYFAFPQKHLFIDFQLQDSPRDSAWPSLAPLLNDRLEVFFLLRKSDGDLERDVSADTFRLGCTPVVNLFDQPADPLLLNHLDSEYQIVPKAGQPLGREIYSIDDVEAVSSNQEVVAYQPFFSWKHGRAGEDRQAFWHASVRAGGSSDPGDPQRLRQEVYLSLVDLGFRPSHPAGSTLRVKTTCFNGDAPGHLPTGAASSGVARPLIHFMEGAGPVTRLAFVAPPTQTLRPQPASRALWRTISHLSLNHLSLVEGPEAAQALREILQLYNHRQAADTQALIDSVIDVQTERVVRRIGWKAGGFGMGLAVHVTIDESRLTGLGGYLLGTVLDRFLAMYVAVNSFTELVVQSKQRKGQEEPWTWPKRAGEKIVL